MVQHAQRVAAGAASRFLADLASHAREGGTDHWHAGGSFPDILHDLMREGHLTNEQYIAGSRLCHDLTRCHGTSCGLTARYGDQVEGGRSEGLPQPFRTDPDAFTRMDRVMSKLRDHERTVLQFCVMAREAKRGTLSDLGRQTTNYKTAKTTKAAATAQVRGLLQSLVELYRDYHITHPS